MTEVYERLGVVGGFIFFVCLVFMMLLIIAAVVEATRDALRQRRIKKHSKQLIEEIENELQ